MSEMSPLELISHINSLLHSIPVEAGMDHPAESFLLQALQKSPFKVGTWYGTLVMHDSDIIYSAVRLLGRVPVENIGGEWGYDLMQEILRRPNEACRDAAVHTLESWRSWSALAILESHRDPAAWIEDYRAKVTSQMIKDRSSLNLD